MTETTDSDVVALLEEATLSDPGALDADAELAELEGWDSMGMVMFINLVTERYGVELSVHDLRDCPTGAALARRIAERRAERA